METTVHRPAFARFGGRVRRTSGGESALAALASGSGGGAHGAVTNIRGSTSHLPGSGGSASASIQDNIANPSPIVADTAVNPLEQDASNRWKSYNDDLAKGTNEEITRELQRARDDLSVGMEAEGAAAVGRGADAGFFKSRRLESGKRDIHALQGNLADKAMGRREGALTGLTSAAGQAASGQRQLHLGTMSARLGEQRLAIDRAESQARLRDAPYDRLLRTMSAYSSILGSGSGLLG